MNGEFTDIDGRKPHKPFDPIGTVLMHWMEIAVFGSVLLVLCLPLAFLLSKPYYTVQGRIMVAPAVSTFIIQSEETPIISYYNAYVRTHVNRIHQRDVIEKALERLEPEIQSLFVPEDTSLSLAASRLLEKVEIDHLTGTHLITLEITGKKPDGLAQLINSIIDVYMSEIQQEVESKEYRRLMYLKDEKEKIEEEIIAQARLFQVIGKEAGTFSFRSEDNAHNTEFEILQEQYVKACSDRILKKGVLDSLVSARNSGSQPSLDPLAREFMAQNSSSGAIHAAIQREMLELSSLLAEYPEAHPGRVKIEAKIASLTDTLSRLKAYEKEETLSMISQKRDLEMDEAILTARAQYEAALQAEEEIRAKRDQALSRRIAVSQKIMSGKQIADKIEHLRTLLNRIDERISELTLESKAPGRLQVESRARIPETPAGSNLKKILAVSFLLSYGLILMICVVYDIFDRRVRDRKDILHGLGSHPTWPISNYRFTGSGLVPFSRITADDTTNVAAKAIQSLSIRLDKERKENNARCAVFMGVDRKCGNTEILLNTAHAITKLCKNVVVIDACFDHPAIGSHLGINGDRPGIMDFLLGKASIRECIVHDDERGLDFILPGRPPSPDDLATMDLSIVPHMIRELKQRYGFIFIDCAPILLSDITEYFILQSDITVMVIQGDKTLYEDLYMASSILFRLQVPAIAAVLNWGAPRNLNKLQIWVSRILWPVEKWFARVSRKELKQVKYFLEEDLPRERAPDLVPTGHSRSP